MMQTVGGIAMTVFLIGLSIFAWWVIRPPKVRPEPKAAADGGPVLSDSDIGSGDGGGD